VATSSLNLNPNNQKGPTMTPRYHQLRHDLLRRRERELAEFEQQVRDEISRFLAGIARAVDLNNKQQVRFEQKLRQVEQWHSDPTVVVRVGPGPEAAVYHEHSGTCSHLSPTTQVQHVLLGEATHRGLRPCQRCRPPAPAAPAQHGVSGDEPPQDCAA
jgi:hypothetical protein